MEAQLLNYGGGFVFEVNPPGSSGCVLIEIEALASEDLPAVINPPFQSVYNSSQIQRYTASVQTHDSRSG
jgi:hypothetical protein